MKINLEYNNFMDELDQIKKDIQEIKERNTRVEKDKAWETSWSRRVLVILLTYVVAVLFFFFAQLPNPFLNAIVPTLGFVLSTASIPFFKKLWLKNKK
jgi:peptidoglycan/LPS O-acetylase OafA/YrhL